MPLPFGLFLPAHPHRAIRAVFGPVGLRREHESQLILYEAAAKAIRDAGVTKLPNLAALKAEYRKLDEEKERLYQKYGEVKKELADYGIIKQNVDSILRVTPHQERTQEL